MSLVASKHVCACVSVLARVCTCVRALLPHCSLVRVPAETQIMHFHHILDWAALPKPGWGCSWVSPPHPHGNQGAVTTAGP